MSQPRSSSYTNSTNNLSSARISIQPPSNADSTSDQLEKNGMPPTPIK